jgi:hypothetical protein
MTKRWYTSIMADTVPVIPLVMIAGGIFLLVVGVNIFNHWSDVHKLCSSEIGQLGQTFDPNAQQLCSRANDEVLLGSTLAIVGLALAIIGGVLTRRGVSAAKMAERRGAYSYPTTAPHPGSGYDTHGTPSPASSGVGIPTTYAATSSPAPPAPPASKLRISTPAPPPKAPVPPPAPRPAPSAPAAEEPPAGPQLKGKLAPQKGTGEKS